MFICYITCFYRHANNHFVEDELESDMELAIQIALAPPSPELMVGMALLFHVAFLGINIFCATLFIYLTRISLFPC